MAAFNNGTCPMAELFLKHGLGLTVQHCYEVAKSTKVDHFSHLSSLGQFLIKVDIVRMAVDFVSQDVVKVTYEKLT